MDKRTNANQPKATRASQLAESLKAAILTGTLVPGQKLALDRLREAQGVSLSPLREAVSRLVPTGLVQMEDQRGYRVSPVSPENLREILVLRRVLETSALAESLRNGDVEWESAVMGSAHRAKRTASDHDAPQPQALAEAHRDLHMALIARCGMPMLTALCGRHLDLFARYVTLFAPGHRTAPAQVETLGALARAAVARDTATAIHLLTRHIDSSGAAIAAGMAASPSTPEPTESAR